MANFECSFYYFKIEESTIVNKDIHDPLFSEYQQAKYVIDENGIEFCFKVGLHYSYLDRLLMAYNAQSTALITAFNPRSQQQTAIVNQQNNHRLKGQIEAGGYVFLSGYGTDEHGRWPKEESFLIFNIERSAVNRFAKSFRQNAYLWIQLNEPVALIDCRH